MFGLEAIFRNGVPVGHLRRSDYGFFIDKTIGYGYIRNPDGGVVKMRHTHTHTQTHASLARLASTKNKLYKERMMISSLTFLLR